MKRGLGHIEVILAFVLFVGFLMFGLFFLNPLDSTRVLDSTLFYAKDEISKNASSIAEIYGIVLKEGTDGDNVAFNLERGEASGYGVRVERAAGARTNSRYENNRVVLQRAGDNFFFVVFGNFPYSEDEFSGQISEISNPQNFTISSVDSREVFSEVQLIELVSRYNEDYDSLRADFNLPRRTEFSFSVKFSSEDKISAEKSIPEGVEVFSDSERVEVLRMDGSRTFADFNVMVW